MYLILLIAFLLLLCFKQKRENFNTYIDDGMWRSSLTRSSPHLQVPAKVFPHAAYALQNNALEPQVV